MGHANVPGRHVDEQPRHEERAYSPVSAWLRQERRGGLNLLEGADAAAHSDARHVHVLLLRRMPPRVVKRLLRGGEGEADELDVLRPRVAQKGLCVELSRPRPPPHTPGNLAGERLELGHAGDGTVPDEQPPPRRLDGGAERGDEAEAGDRDAADLALHWAETGGGVVLKAGRQINFKCRCAGSCREFA